MTKLLVIGAGGHGKETAYIAKEAGFEVVGFLDDDQSKHGKIFGEFCCIGPISCIDDHKECEVVVAIGASRMRKKVVEALLVYGARFATIIHPKAILIGNTRTIGEGSMIFPNAILSENVVIGAHAILNFKSSISHDVVAGDFLTLNPSATVCGGCCIASGVEVGAGATVKQGISIHSGVLIGAGAVVVSVLDANASYVGVPARRLNALEIF